MSSQEQVDTINWWHSQAILPHLIRFGSIEKFNPFPHTTNLQQMNLKEHVGKIMKNLPQYEFNYIIKKCWKHFGEKSICMKERVNPVPYVIFYSRWCWKHSSQMKSPNTWPFPSFRCTLNLIYKTCINPPVPHTTNVQQMRRCIVKNMETFYK